MSKIIEVTQKPIIEYSIIDEIAQNVEAKIQSLNIDTLEPTEDNLSLIKSTRAELNNDFKTLEEQRKMVKDIVLKDYKAFEEKYKKLIQSKFEDADTSLKIMVDSISDGILKVKVNGLIDYFENVNKYDFVRFEDLNLKIIKSISDKKLKEEIDEYLADVNQSLSTIAILPNNDRILAKFQMSKNLSDAIAQTNMEIQREEQIKAQNEARVKAEQERAERNAEIARQQKEQYEEQETEQYSHDVYDEPAYQSPMVEQPQQFSTTFKVIGTREQIAMLKQFMQENNIKYEGVSK